MSDPVKSGDTIKVNYTGRFENKEIFDTSEGKDPLKFTVGAGQLIQGFDSGVIGMNVGDKKTITISPEQGYGIRNEDMIVELPKSTIPEEMVLEVGMQLQLMELIHQLGRPSLTVARLCPRQQPMRYRPKHVRQPR